MNEKNELVNTNFDNRVISFLHDNCEDYLRDHECIINYRKYRIDAYSFSHLPCNIRMAISYSYIGTIRIRRFNNNYYFIASMIEIPLSEKEINRNISIKKAQDKLREERIASGFVKKQFIEKPEEKEKYMRKLTKILDAEDERFAKLMKEIEENKSSSLANGDENTYDYYGFYMDMLEGGFHRYMGESVDIYNMGDYVRYIDSENYEGRPNIVIDHYKDGRIIRH